MADTLFDFEEELTANDGPVTCLGIHFDNDKDRREYFRAELRKKLPELKLIEGFPLGSDDDIIALSNPPYYTACPNPWLNDFIHEWKNEQNDLLSKGLRSQNHDIKEPYAKDVSTGKYTSIYFKHPYHTKVPIAAISEYISHYAQKGDIILDGFAGTGMTGVAAQVLKNLYNTISIDLSPIASFINYYYNYPDTVNNVNKAFEKVINTIKKDLSWMYKTKHPNGGYGTISSVIWSEVYQCPTCGNEEVFWEGGVDVENGKILPNITCKRCGAHFNKSQDLKVFETKYDNILNEAITEVKLVPVRISYEFNHKTYYKTPDKDDLELLTKIDETKINEWVPTNQVEDNLSEISRILNNGYHSVHQLYFKRCLAILSSFNALIGDNSNLKGILTSIAFRANKRYALTYMNGKWGAGGGPTNGTYYIPSLIKELNAFDVLDSALKKCNNAYFEPTFRNIISTQSSTHINIPENSIDYIFTDPPFGGNFVYSELNYIWESWLKIFTNNKEESITSDTYSKGITEYRNLMTSVFKEYFRVLKPGKWITVEFSNTQSAIWNALRMSLQDAGFIICNVATLDKQKGSFVSQTTSTAVKQDLVITCFKPSDSLQKKFYASIDSSKNIWEFIEELMMHLPVHLIKENATTAVVDRSAKILFDRLIAYYVQHGYQVPIDASEFQKELRERFVERDGMFFTPEQAIEYDEKKKNTTSFVSLALLVGSEAEGIEWLKRKLENTPKTYSELQPDWMQNLVRPKKGDTLPELMQILEENFIKDEKGLWHIPDINDQVQLDALKNKRFLKIFDLYVDSKRKIKNARQEVLRAGFNECYKKKDFATIINVGNKIEEELLTNDEVLQRFYDIASTRV